MKFLWKKLYKELDKERNGESWRQIAKRGDFSPSLFTRIAQGKPISVDNLCKVLLATKHRWDFWLFVKSNK